MNANSLTRGGALAIYNLARWAIVQLAGQRILAPSIKVRILVAQPQRVPIV